jgi:uncharacterized Zn finger protein
MFYDWRPYVSAATRRHHAAREVARLKKTGRVTAPVVIEGRKIATTFWGQAWCENLERYSDFANRLPRGRTYARNGSVIDLQIAAGAVKALVSGSHLYTVAVTISPVPAARWRAICRACTGAIDSLVELLQGRFSRAVMDRLCREKTGLFPAPSEMAFECSCPDWASMCKHVAAVLYGVGARLDERPELLFALRGTDEKELIARAGSGMSTAARTPARGKILDERQLADIFGFELAGSAEPAAAGARRAAKRARQPAVSRARNNKAIGKTRNASAPGASRAASRRTPGQSPRG